VAKTCNRINTDLDEVHWEGEYNLEWFWVWSVPDCFGFVVMVADQKAVWRGLM